MGKALIIGAGGVARAIGFVLVKSGVRSLALFDIDVARAGKLASDLEAKQVSVLTSEKSAEFRKAVSTADLLVNCTPLGMKHGLGEKRAPVDEKLISD